MKKIFFKLFAVVLSLLILSSCSISGITRTKKILSVITQTDVIEKDYISDNEAYADFTQKFKSDFTVPGLLEGVIPQGFCYCDTYEYFIISGYYEDGKLPSVIMIVEAKKGSLISYHPLCLMDGSNYTGHAGGVASSENTLYITSDNLCYTISLDNLNTTKSGEKISFESQFKINTKGSFAGYNNGILWIGDFIESDKKEREKVQTITTLDSGETFYAYCEGYILDDGLPSVKKINSSSDGYIPDYMIAIPEQVQGIGFTDTDKIVFSTSYGRKNNSQILIYEDVFATDRVGTYNVDNTTVDLFACSSTLLDRTIEAPPMSEGITSYNDNLYILFESGAAKYRSHGGKKPVDTVYKGIIQ